MEQITLKDVPELIGHAYRPVEMLSLDYLNTEQAIKHRRLGVFHRKGLKCAHEGCPCVGVYLIRGASRSGGIHTDLYTADFQLMTVDHIKPKCKGGPDTFENKQPMCQFHNERKGGKWTEGKQK